MLHFILWLNLLCTSITQGILKDIANGFNSIGGAVSGGGIPGLSDLTNKVNTVINKVNLIPTISTVVNEIDDFVQDIDDFVEDIEDTVDTVANEVEGIFNDVADLVKLLDNPLNIEVPSHEITDLANTLAVCMEDMKQLIPGAVLLDGIIDVGKDILDQYFDPEDVVFKTLAGGLLPLKSQVEFVCFDILPTVISVMQKILDQSLSVADKPNLKIFEQNANKLKNKTNDRAAPPQTTDDPALQRREQRQQQREDRRNQRRQQRNQQYDEEDGTRRLGDAIFEPEDNDGFWTSKGVTYAYDVSPFHKAMVGVLSVAGFFAYDYDVETFGKEGNDPDVFAVYRTVKYILGVLRDITADVVSVASDCGETAALNWLGGKCAISIKTRAIKIVVDLFVGVVDFLVESAQYHGGGITAAKINAIFQDREVIIHNQLMLRDHIATLQASINELSNGNSANAEYGVLMDGVNERTGDEGLTVINLRIKTSDLYVVGGFIVGFIATFIGMIVVLILKCCNGSNSGYHRVVKYETESEIEQK